MARKTDRKSGVGVACAALASLVALAGVGCGVAVEPGSSMGGLRLEPEAIDLGTLALFEPRSFEARLTNDCTVPIRIGLIDSDCTCASLEVGEKDLAPGASMTLRGVFREKSRQGSFQPRIVVLAEAPSQAAAVLSVAAVVEASVRVEPREIAISPNVETGAPGTARLSLTNASAVSIELHEVQDLPEGVSAAWDQAHLEPGQKATLALSASADQALLGWEGEIRLRTSHPTEKSIRVALRLEPIGGVALAPRELHLGVVSRADLLRRPPLRVFLKPPTGRTLEVIRVEPPPFLEHAGTETTEGGGAEISLRAAGDVAENMLSGHVRLTVRIGESNREIDVTIPVTGIVRDAQ